MSELFLDKKKGVNEMDTVTRPINTEEPPEAVIAEMLESAAFNAQRFDQFPPEYQCWFNGEIVVARKSVADRLVGFASRLKTSIARDRSDAFYEILELVETAKSLFESMDKVDAARAEGREPDDDDIESLVETIQRMKCDIDHAKRLLRKRGFAHA